METKSRYEVIADLEKQKRDLIREKNGLNDVLRGKETKQKEMERTKADNIMVLDRKIEDLKEDVDNFKKTMEERKETITELVKSIDESLARFGKLAEAQK